MKNSTEQHLNWKWTRPIDKYGKCIRHKWVNSEHHKLKCVSLKEAIVKFNNTRALVKPVGVIRYTLILKINKFKSTFQMGCYHVLFANTKKRKQNLREVY